MSRRKSRRLTAEEEKLWRSVADTTEQLRQEPLLRMPESHLGAGTEPNPTNHPTPPRKRIAPFSIGTQVPETRRGNDLAPSLAGRLAEAPLRMDRKQHERMRRGRLAPDARIDLHGMTLAQAHPVLVRFILGAAAHGKRLVLVITGKGRPGDDFGPIPQRPGALKQQVPAWLHQAPLGPHILQVTQAHARHGGAGAYYVYLRRAR